MYILVKKLNLIKKDLEVPNSKLFGNFISKIYPRLNSWLASSVKQREKLVIFNQCCWGKYARKKWLF